MLVSHGSGKWFGSHWRSYIPYCIFFFTMRYLCFLFQFNFSLILPYWSLVAESLRNPPFQAGLMDLNPTRKLGLFHDPTISSLISNPHISLLVIRWLVSESIKILKVKHIKVYQNTHYWCIKRRLDVYVKFSPIYSRRDCV